MAYEAFLKPEEAIEALDIRPGEKVADFGCGAGFFSVPIAQRLGPQGKVYAMDIRQEALEATRAKARLFHLLNLETVRADLELPQGSGLRDNSVDKILISNILFQAENKKTMLEEAYRILKTGGSAAIIEWGEEQSAAVPSLERRVSPSEAKELLEKTGFSFFKEFNAGSHHYGLIFKK